MGSSEITPDSNPNQELPQLSPISAGDKAEMIKALMSDNEPTKAQVIEQWLHTIVLSFTGYTRGIRNVVNATNKMAANPDKYAPRDGISRGLTTTQRKQVESILGKLHQRLQEESENQVKQITQLNTAVQTQQGNTSGKKKLVHPPSIDQRLLMLGLLLGSSNILERAQQELGYDNLSDAQKIYLVQLHQLRTCAPPEFVLFPAILPALTARFETFLSALLRMGLTFHPDAMGMERKQVTLADVRKYQDPNDLERSLVDKAINELISGSPSEWRIALSKWPGVDLAACTDNWSAFLEIFLRRNSVVHTASVVDEKYLHLLPDDLPKPPLGLPLLIDRSYLLSAIDRLECAAFALLMLWPRKIAKKLEISVDIPLSLYLYDVYDRKHWTISALLTQLYIDNYSDSIMVHEMQINSWMSRLEVDVDSRDEVMSEIDDWSAPPDDRAIQLALHILRNEDTAAISLISKAVESGEMTGQILREWPLVKKLAMRAPSIEKILQRKPQPKPINSRKRR